MKYFLILVLLLNLMYSCAFTQEDVGYNFDNFKGTSLWELAMAVRNDDAEKVQYLLNNEKVNINFKDPLFEQSLLSLSIVNNKRNAFLELLKSGANPNEFLGEFKDETPLVKAILNQENCDLFFVDNLLKYGADPNLEIKYSKTGNYYKTSFPLLIALSKKSENGKDCVNLIKLLISKGADINVCYEDSISGICEGVISYCLRNDSMSSLKYFIIERKIIIPNYVYAKGGVNEPLVKYKLKEILLSEDFEYSDLRINNIFYDRSEIRNEKEEIINYLEKTKQ